MDLKVKKIENNKMIKFEELDNDQIIAIFRVFEQRYYQKINDDLCEYNLNWSDEIEQDDDGKEVTNDQIIEEAKEVIIRINKKTKAKKSVLIIKLDIGKQLLTISGDYIEKWREIEEQIIRELIDIYTLKGQQMLEKSCEGFEVPDFLMIKNKRGRRPANKKKSESDKATSKDEIMGVSSDDEKGENVMSEDDEKYEEAADRIDDEITAIKTVQPTISPTGNETEIKTDKKEEDIDEDEYDIVIRKMEKTIEKQKTALDKAKKELEKSRTALKIEAQQHQKEMEEMKSKKEELIHPMENNEEKYKKKILNWSNMCNY